MFYFGKRPLADGTFGGAWTGPISDYFNLEDVHEHGFFEDGSNIGFGPDGRFSEHPIGKNYTFYLNQRYDDNIIREAIKNIIDGEYSLLFNNCQDWAERLRNEYYSLLKEKEQSPCQ